MYMGMRLYLLFGGMRMRPKLDTCWIWIWR